MGSQARVWQTLNPGRGPRASGAEVPEGAGAGSASVFYRGGCVCAGCESVCESVCGSV